MDISSGEMPPATEPAKSVEVTSARKAIELAEGRKQRVEGQGVLRSGPKGVIPPPTKKQMRYEDFSKR